MPAAPSQKPQFDRQRRLGSEAVLLVTQFYRPEILGSAPFCADIAEWLAGQGSDVTVLTAFPHYPEPDQFDRGRYAAQERLKGVAVERLKSWIPAGRSARQRIAAEVSFLLLGLWAIVSGRIPRHPIVVALCPSIFSVAIGWVARRRGGRLVAVVHDIQSGLAKGLGLVGNAALQRAMLSCERAVLNRADAIVVLSREMKLELRRIGVVRPIQIVPIWVDTEAVKPAPERTDRPPRLLYSGNLGRKQGLDQLIAMAQELEKSRPDIEIIFRGGGGERSAIQAQVAALGLQNIHFDELLASENFGEGLADGDIHLVPQDPATASFAVPSKVYSIMSAGRPFVATANPGSPLWRLRRESRAFVAVPANDRSGLARTVLRMLNDSQFRAALGRRGRRFVEEQCARPKVLSRLSDLLWTANERGPHLLVFEPEHAGHQLEWLRHLVRFAATELVGTPVTFVVAPEIFADLSTEADSVESDHIRVVSLRPHEARRCRHSRLVVSAGARWWTLLVYALRTRATSIHVLALDHLSLPLALGLGVAGRLITGTLFRPSVHYRLIGSYRPSLPERIRDLRKAVLYRLMLRNRRLGAVLSLDPYFPGYAKQFYRGGAKVRLLQDPAHPASRIERQERTVADRLPKERTTFLLFGYLTERKGVMALLDALRQLDVDHRSRTAVMLAGRIDPAIREATLEKYQAVLHQCPELWLDIEERRLSAGELEALVQRAQVLVAPYQRFVGSSGILLWAARSGKPILTQDYGLMGPLVREFGLGLSVDTTDPSAIARAMMDIVDGGPRATFDRRAAWRFSSSHTPEAFASAIFASL
jgi:glycosyltransferase involved in cell wall biosynthesis